MIKFLKILIAKEFIKTFIWFLVAVGLVILMAYAFVQGIEKEIIRKEISHSINCKWYGDEINEYYGELVCIRST